LAVGVAAEVKSRLPVLDVVGETVQLRKAGTTYKGLCPFHSEKTPSFIVTPGRESWHCFGCGEGGDIFSFVMRRDGLTFPEALRLLAARAGVEIDERTSREDAHRRRLHEVVESAIAFYHAVLTRSAAGERALAYLHERGFNDETIEWAALGWAPGDWDAMGRTLEKRRQITTGELVEAGLATPRKGGEGAYDRFRARVVFPIRDATGNATGLGGRVLKGAGGAEPEGPKYLNSPATPLFDKSRTLYLLDRAKAQIRKTGTAVIVEGYTDALMAHQAGFTNVVASLGTALTPGQVALLIRYAAKKIILAYDVDPAGEKAGTLGVTALEALTRQLAAAETDVELDEVRVARLPDGKDPDEVIRESPAHWAQLISQAKPVMDYYFDALTAGLDLTTAKGKADAVRVLGPLIADLGDRVQRTHYLQQLARLVQVDERTLWQQIRQATGHKGPAAPSQPKLPAEEPKQAALALDEHCLSFLLYHPELLAVVDESMRACQEEPLRAEDLSRPDDRALLAAWRSWIAREGVTNVRGPFYDTLDERLQDRVDTLLRVQEAQPSVPEDLLKDKVRDAIPRLRLKNLRRQNRELFFLQEDAQATGDREMLRRYVQSNIEATARIRRLEQAMNERSMAGRRQREDTAVRVPLTTE
jgi:DNA primase